MPLSRHVYTQSAKVRHALIVALSVTAAATLAGCSGSAQVDSPSRQAAAPSASAPDLATMTPAADSSAHASKATIIITNNLGHDVELRSTLVNNGDWAGVNPTPASPSPEGFSGDRLTPGQSVTRVFSVLWQAAKSDVINPFTLTVIADGAATAVVDLRRVEFQRSYIPKYEQGWTIRGSEPQIGCTSSAIIVNRKTGHEGSVDVTCTPGYQWSTTHIALNPTGVSTEGSVQ